MSEPETPQQSTTLKRLGAAAALMVFAVFLSRVIGFLREMFIAARFGANWETDAYNAAFLIPDWLNHLVAGGTLSITFLPIYAKYLAEKNEPEANRALSTVTTIMLAVLGLGVVAGELLARPLVEGYFHRLDPRAVEATVRYTRILLPAQIFFFVGGVANATLFARGKFAAGALAPLLYNVGIIAGGFALGDALGVEALAWGALAGAFVGPFLIPTIDAIRNGARFRPSFAARHPGFVEWVLLSLPLMIGASLVTADDWVIRYFASEDPGAITRLGYAKRLVAVAIAVAGQAVGQASMPFFARLFAEGKRLELARTFARTTRSASVFALLVVAWMIALAEPMIDLLFRRGKFSPGDVEPTAMYMAIFAAAVPLWTVQGLAARAFYAARNTLTPMIAGTIVTVLSIPVYALLYREAGPTGLAIASGIGILGHTGALLLLAPKLLPELREVVGAELRGLGAGALLATLAGAATWGATRAVSSIMNVAGHRGDVIVIAAGSIAFAIVVFALAKPLGVDEPLVVVRKIAGRLRRRRR